MNKQQEIIVLLKGLKAIVDNMSGSRLQHDNVDTYINELNKLTTKSKDVKE